MKNISLKYHFVFILELNIFFKKEWRQVNEKGHIGIVEKAKETSSDSGMHNRPITVLHEQWISVSWNAETHPHHTV